MKRQKGDTFLDDPLSGREVRAVASHAARIHPETRESLESIFSGNKSPDFYRGLLTGLARARGLFNSDMDEAVDDVMAFVADKMERKEIV